VIQRFGGGVYFHNKDGPPPHEHAAIVREHPWAVTWGACVLLLGLLFQVVAALL
jgi:hypothetical protein